MINKPVGMLCLVASLILAACGSGNATGDCSIQGTVTEKSCESKYVYMANPFTNEVLDSAKINGGVFNFAALPVAEGLNAVVQLSIIPDNNPLFTTSLPVILQGGTVQVTLGDEIKSKGTLLNDQLYRTLLDMQMKSDDLYEVKNMDAATFHNEITNACVTAIKQNRNTPVGLYLYWRYRNVMDTEAWENLPKELGGEFERQAASLKKD